MKHKKKFLCGFAFILCVILAAPVFAGGQGTTQTGRQGINPNMNLTGLPIVRERETYTIMMQRTALSQNNMLEKEPVIRAARDTNITINWIEVASAGWMERINITFAAGDLPDAIVRPPVDIFMQNLPQFVDLTDLIEPYSPNITQFFTRRPDIRSLVTAPDGRIYSFPVGDETFWGQSPDSLFMNKVWLDALGLPVPVTTEDFYNVLVAFRDNDMNGNGDRNDEIPFAFCMEGDGRIGSMFGSFGVLDNIEHLQIINDVVTFTPSRPEYLEALRYFNRLFAAGLMDPEGFSQSPQQFTAKGMERPGVYGSVITNIIGNVVGADNRDFIPVPPMLGPNGRSLWNQSRATGLITVGLVISNRCRSPETLVRWYDYINSTLEIALYWDSGPAGLAWVWDPDGRWRTTTALLPEGMTWGQARHTGGVGTVSPAFTQIYGMNTTATRNIDDITTVTKLASLALKVPFLPQNILPTGLEEASVLQERAILYTDINTYIRSFVATSVMHGITDAQWNAHLQNLQRLNVARYVQSYQALFDRSR
jgi:putative aldouronate transport system substrate-binding protein